MSLRVGVIGLGRIGLMHARNLAQAADVAEVVLIGRDPDRTAEAASRLDAALVPDAREELRGEHAPEGPAADRSTRLHGDGWLDGLDGVVIASSTGSHPALLREVASAGVPVLVEKPIALELDEQIALAEDLADAPTPIMVAFHRRYDAGFQRLRERVAAGDAGRVRLVHAISHDHFHITEDYIPTSGGIWRDMVVHDFDVVPWLVGEAVVSVFATGAVLDSPAYAEHGDVDTASAILTFASGAQALISAGRNMSSGHDVRTVVYGSEDAFSAGEDGRVPVTSTEPGVPGPEARHEEFENRFEPAFRAEIDHFLAVIRGEAESLTPPGDGIPAMRLALAAEESQATGRPVAVS